MTPDSIVTIITGVLQAGGVGVFLCFLFRAIAARLKSLEAVVEAQKRAIESVEIRANEAEKIAALYKGLMNELPDLLEKQRKLTSQLKDDIIKAQEKLLRAKESEPKEPSITSEFGQQFEELTSSGLQHLHSLEIGLENLQEKSKVVLGLDVGANSLGWALVDHTNGKLIDAGVRLFDRKEG